MTNAVLSAIAGTAHEVSSDGLKLFVWEKHLAASQTATRVALLVHGATYSGATDFDVQVAGSDASFMEY